MENAKWYQNDFCVKMILDSWRMHWQQNHNLACVQIYSIDEYSESLKL